MELQLDVLDDFCKDMVRSALEKNELELLNTTIAQVERFTVELKDVEIDEAIAFAAILLVLEDAKWELDNPSNSNLT